MDYEVFMLTRMREAYDETGSTDKAIELGLARTGKLVTSAALVLMFAFLVLSTSPGYEIKPLAIGLAARIIFDAIIFDATVIRALLVPAPHPRGWAVARSLSRACARGGQGGGGGPRGGSRPLDRVCVGGACCARACARRRSAEAGLASGPPPNASWRWGAPRERGARAWATMGWYEPIARRRANPLIELN